ncbi:MAG: hypothetical protein KJN78_03820, partial [Gammaproteobacteria bacterium]|nr:hypothetical protein [Gammaproteobacteria bacterium]
MIRKTLCTAVLLCSLASPAVAEITFHIEEPAEGSVRSGISLISGWAISDEGIVSVEAFINGESLGLLPYGSARGDVGAAFPDVPDSSDSGWAMKWAWSLSGEGEHTITVVVTEEGGATASKDVTFEVVRFESNFVSNPDDVLTAGAIVESPEDGRLAIRGAQVEGQVVDIELAWDTGSQQFLIDRILGDGEPAPNKAPTAEAGGNLSTVAGSRVTVTGSGHDSDGHIINHHWSQVDGPTVSLANPDQWSTSFTAPEQAGTVRLRLEVTDNDGMTDSDDVLVDVTAAPNKAPTVWAGSDLNVEIGSSVSITGSANDEDGEVVNWAWTRVAGSSVSLQDASSPTVRFTAPASEGYTRLRLRVTDDDGATDYDEVVVNFYDPTPVNQSPTADAGNDFQVDAGDSVTVTGGGSDPDGSIVNWSWSQVSGTAVSLSGASTQEVSFTAPDDATTIRLRLRVTDDDGATDTDDVSITVKAATPSTTTGGTLQSMLDDLNAARGQAQDCDGDGSKEKPALPPLVWSASLADIATQHSMDMAARGYFAHDTEGGPSMSERVWPYWNGSRIGENIAASSHDQTDAHVV